MHKFRIEAPKSIALAYVLDKKNGNILWADAISTEMKDVIYAFKKLENRDIVPIGYHRVNCHIIFDVKMEDFSSKSMLVAGGRVAEPPATMTYTNVVLK